MKTTAAQTAQLIRAEIKKQFPKLKISVTSETYSMGNSIRIKMIDQEKDIFEQIKILAKKYQYGHFDGMNDIYEYSNCNKDIPQVKFVFVENNMSDEKRQSIYNNLRKNWLGGQELPEHLYNAYGKIFHGQPIDRLIYRIFTGAIQI